MSSGSAQISSSLYKGGWKQGAVIAVRRLYEGGVPKTRLLSVTSVNHDAKLVVASQNCDIVAALDREPAIETLICDMNMRSNVGSIANSSRYFAVDPVEGLVAYASKRVIIPKEVLRGLRPDPFTWETERFPLFQQWLADRWRRADFPDQVAQYFGGPLAKALRNAKKKEPDIWDIVDSRIYQFRIACEEEISGFPLNIRVIALVKPSTPSEELAKIRRFVGVVIDEANSTDGRPVDIEELRFSTPAHLSLADAWVFRPLDLDYLSIGDDSGTAVAGGVD